VHDSIDFGDAELNEAVEKVGTNLSCKHVSLRQAVKAIDEDRDGFIGRDDAKRFFKTMGFSEEMGDRFFDQMDKKGDGLLDYQKFRKIVGPYMQKGYDSGSVATVYTDKTSASSEVPRASSRQCRTTSQAASHQSFKSKAQDVSANLEELGEKMAQKHTNTHKAFRNVVTDKEGQISRTEVQRLFYNYGYGAKMADQVFDNLDSGCRGTISAEDLKQQLQPYMQPR
jgi:Ca2+-binding EF-hand superfamily protein